MTSHIPAACLVLSLGLVGRLCDRSEVVAGWTAHHVLHGDAGYTGAQVYVMNADGSSPLPLTRGLSPTQGWNGRMPDLGARRLAGGVRVGSLRDLCDRSRRGRHLHHPGSWLQPFLVARRALDCLPECRSRVREAHRRHERGDRRILWTARSGSRDAPRFLHLSGLPRGMGTHDRGKISGGTLMVSMRRGSELVASPSPRWVRRALMAPPDPDHPGWSWSGRAGRARHLGAGGRGRGERRRR